MIYILLCTYFGCPDLPLDFFFIPFLVAPWSSPNFLFVILPCWPCFSLVRPYLYYCVLSLYLSLSITWSSFVFSPSPFLRYTRHPLHLIHTVS